MATVEEIVAKLAELVEETTLGAVVATNVKPESRIMSDLGLDSLDYATIMLSCEQWLGIKIKEDSVNWKDVQTIRQLAQVLRGNQASG